MQRRDLRRDALEQRRGRRLARDERRDPAQRRLLVGEHPRRPLAGHQALLGLAALGDVAERRHDSLRPAVAPEHRRRAGRHPAGRAVRPDDARDDAGLGRAGAQRVVAEQPLGGDAGAGVVHDLVEDVLGPLPPQLRALPAEDLLGRGVAVADRPARVAHDEALGHRVHHRPQPLLVGDERLARPLPLGRDRGQHERRQGRGRDEQLARLQAVGDRLAHERARRCARCSRPSGPRRRRPPSRPRAARSAARPRSVPGRRRTGRRAGTEPRPAGRGSPAARRPRPVRVGRAFGRPGRPTSAAAA